MNPPIIGGPVLGRRRFTGGLSVGLVAACAVAQRTQATAVDPGSNAVAEWERARRAAGQRAVDFRLDAVTGQVDDSGRIVSTWSYGGKLPGQEIRVRRGDVLRGELRNAVIKMPDAASPTWRN